MEGIAPHRAGAEGGGDLNPIAERQQTLRVRRHRHAEPDDGDPTHAGQKP
jgi:hypothetical protein